MSLLNLTALSITEIFGDFKLKEYAMLGSKSALLQGIIGYVGVIYLLIRSLKGANVMYVNGLWDGTSGLIETVAAYYLLGDRLESVWQYCGILLICCGTVLLHCAGGSGITA